MNDNRKSVRDHLSCWDRPVEFGDLTVVEGRYFLDGVRVSKYNIRKVSIVGGVIEFVEFKDRLVVISQGSADAAETEPSCSYVAKHKKLSDSDVRMIRSLCEIASQAAVAFKMGVSQNTVSLIMCGKIRSSVV